MEEKQLVVLPEKDLQQIHAFIFKLAGDSNEIISLAAKQVLSSCFQEIRLAHDESAGKEP